MARPNGSTIELGCIVAARSKLIADSRNRRTLFRSRTQDRPEGLCRLLLLPSRQYVVHGTAKRKAMQPLMSSHDASSSGPWPIEIRLRKDKKALTVAFDSGESFELAAEYLRVKSPSAEVQGHAPEERKTVPAKAHVAILE